MPCEPQIPLGGGLQPPGPPVVAELPLRRGGEVVGHALVDPEFAHLAAHRWSLDRDGYVVASPRRGVKLRLHRVVLGLKAADGLEGDHINGDKRDNRRANLRACTRQENGQNVPAQRGHRGVTYDASRRGGDHWRVRIGLGGRSYHVGWFASERDAITAAEAWYAEHMPFANPERHHA